MADLIERELGVHYHPGHVWKVLIALGWSPQRPTGRARERNDHVREIHRDGRCEGWVLLSTGERVRLNKTGWRKLIAMNGMA